MNHQNKLRSETDFNLSTIMPSTWEGVEIDKVNWIPEGGIDSLKIYELNTTASTCLGKQPKKRILLQI